MSQIYREQQRALFLTEKIREGGKLRDQAIAAGHRQTAETLTADLTFWNMELCRLQEKLGLLACFVEEE
ncbi:hypothetical protein GCM10007416_22770 [Kroppenstedtia guangzhouensis]|jgi:hypothetical protein|uniref:Uncharacterized protein n=1 Tax=Kroppenstedtia guangzhouensis TaxID=1274356 RepID=A0ABQ1GRP3_9BACL|nr:hypothetical protein [Kroppenstedtia guangzhouensis]GGA49095.1 hypothetical protein GCM10007416_22770 [Kroppenstedtia guangzhouensis]